MMTPTLAPGMRLGPYEIVQFLGAGGMGEVFKARDTRLDRTVAIKVAAAQFTERFEREARAVAALNHPHICQLYDVGPNYLVMEFIEGAPLRGPLPLEKTVDYAGQILDALDAAHAKGITHRDLKPANILATKQGIKLLDFGLAKQSAGLTESDTTPTRGLTGRGQIVGTLHYMSPEQLQGRAVDPRSDLFSFGCVLYEILTGKRAFEGTNQASVIAAILEREPAPLEVARPLDRVVRRALAKDPDQRFQTARDLKAALAWALEQPPASTASRPIRRWWIAVAAATLVLGALGGWVAATFSQRSVSERVLRLQIDPPSGGRFVFGAGVGGVAISPDGKTAAYVAAANGRTALWVRPLDSTEARLIAGTDDAAHPFWSPDGKSIAFFAETKLLRVDVTGASLMTVCEGVVTGRGGAWTNDGRILFASAGRAIFQVPASGGTPAPLTTLDRGELSHYWPQMLPGDRFLYFARSQAREHNGIYAASLSRPTERVRLLATEINALYAPGGDGKGYLLWLRGATLLAQEFDATALELVGEPRPVADPVGSIANQGRMNVAVSASGLLIYDVSNTLRQLTWLDRTGTRLGVVGEPGADSQFRLSPDSRHVVVARDGASGADLWLLDVERGVSSRFTSNPGVNLWPAWAPDSRTIAFSSGSSRNLVRRPASGAGGEQRLVQSPNLQNPLDWSRDGRFLLYYEIAPDTQRDLWVLPMTPDGNVAREASGEAAKPKPYLQTRFNEWQGRFSPEPSPRWVAYTSDESGRFEVYVQAFPEPRGASRISTGGGTYPQWGVGGRELFYLAPDGSLMVVSLKLGADAVEAANPLRLFALPTRDPSLTTYDVAPNGKRFLVSAPLERAPQPLTVIVNWPALLKREATAR